MFTPSSPKVLNRAAFLLAIIFFFSGFSSLIYQVIWQRSLTLYYGVGAVASTIIVSVYMLGLGLGALAGGKIADKVSNRLLLYFVVEFLLGCFGLVSLPFIHSLGQWTAGSSYLVSFFCIFLFLIFPTFLMGMTLPLLTNIFHSIIRNFLYTVSFLYFINTIGAAIGALCASYLIISFFGLDGGVYVAVTINLILACLIYTLRDSLNDSAEKAGKSEAASVSHDKEGSWGKIIFLFVFMSGFLAIGYEIIWFRVIGVLVKASPYAFSSILAVYLLGIALGSHRIFKFLERHPQISRKDLFFFIQFLIGVSIAISFIGYYYLTKYSIFSAATRYSFEFILHPTIESPDSLYELFSFIYSGIDVFIWSFFFVLFPTLLMGASFPLMAALALGKTQKTGETVGFIYFFNILGNVFGGLLTGFVLLPWLKTEKTLLLFSLIGILAVLFIKKAGSRTLTMTAKTVFAGMLVILCFIFFPLQGQIYQIMHPKMDGWRSYFEEGLDGVVMAYEKGEELTNYINGRTNGGRPNDFFYYEAMEAAYLARQVDDVLIIGYGTGSITEAVLKLEEVKNITLIEINHELIRNLRKMPLFDDMLKEPVVKLIFDDARRVLSHSKEKYDVILMDPLRTTTAYSNNLYSAQFFEIAKKRLKPGGVLMAWMDEHIILPKTIASVFDHVRVYDQFCLASNEPVQKNEARKQRLLERFPAEKRDEIEESAEYLGDKEYIDEISRGYPINLDWKPNCEYYIGYFIRQKLFWSDR